MEALSGREGFFAEKGGVSLVRNRDLRPAAKANPTIQQAFERFQKYNRLKNLSQGSLDFYAAKGRSFFRFLGDTEQPIHADNDSLFSFITVQQQAMNFRVCRGR